MSAFAGLIVGLGNPGPNYEQTRHNMGFLCVDRLLDAVERESRPVSELSGGRFRCLLWKAELPDRQTWLVAKPQTFMNLSGECVQPLAAWHRLEPGRIVVVHDELDLQPGRMRFKIGGGNAGHNGLASITQRLGTADFYRLRLGIGKPEGYDGASYVLGRFATEQLPLLTESLAAGTEGVLLFMRKGATPAQQFCNGFNAMSAN